MKFSLMSAVTQCRCLFWNYERVVCTDRNKTRNISLSLLLLLIVHWDYQWRIQDFPGGATTLDFGAKTYYFARFLPKTAWKWKALDQEGARLYPPPPDLPMVANSYSFWISLNNFSSVISVTFELSSFVENKSRSDKVINVMIPNVLMAK